MCWKEGVVHRHVSALCGLVSMWPREPLLMAMYQQEAVDVCPRRRVCTWQWGGGVSIASASAALSQRGQS